MAARTRRRSRTALASLACLALSSSLSGCDRDTAPAAPAAPATPTRDLPTRGLALLDSNAPVPAEVLAMVGPVPSDSLQTQLVWLGPAEGDRVGVALIAYDEQTRQLASKAAEGQLAATRAELQAAADECQRAREEHPDAPGGCPCCRSCFEEARRRVFGPRRAVFHLLRVTKPAEGPAHLDRSTRWERQGRLAAATIHAVVDQDGDDRAEVDLTTVIAPRPGDGCDEAGIEERILDADTFTLQLVVARDTERLGDGGLVLAHRALLLPRERSGRTDFEVHEAWWAGEPAPPEVMPEGQGRVASPDAVRQAFERGERAWWDERYVLRYDAAADRWGR